MFGIALLMLSLITAVILGLMAGPTSPLTWVLVAILVAIPFIHRKLSAKHFIEWKDEYSVGLDSIDQQHRLVDYTKTHFTFEEGLMEDNGYPDFEAHKAKHRAMIAEVEAVLAEYEKDHDAAMRHASDYLHDWLINHINGTDKQYSSFLIGKGVN
jgi:hemerythrin